MIIYLDLIFLSNFFGDYLCLCLTNIIYAKIPLWRRLLSATAGGIYGVIVCLPHTAFLSSLPAKAVAGVILAVICYAPARTFSIIRAAGVIIISSMLLCGGCELIAAKQTQLSIMLSLFASACLIYCSAAWLRSQVYARHLGCTLCRNGKKLHISGFYDSGNRLCFGSESNRVIVADERVLKSLINKDASLSNLREWLSESEILQIPFSGAAGGTLVGITLDYAKIDGRRYDDVVLGICENRIDEKIILHSTMV